MIRGTRKQPLLILAHERTDGTYDAGNLVEGLEGKVVVVEAQSQDEGKDGHDEDAVEHNEAERVRESLHDHVLTRKISILNGKRRADRYM